MEDGPVGVQDDDGAGKKPGQRSVDEGDPVILAEARPERGADEDVVDALGRAETAGGKRKVGRDADHRGVVQRRRPLVELADRRRAHAGVDAREDVEDDALAREGLARQVGKVGGREGKGGRGRADRRQFADGVGGFSMETSGRHKSIFEASSAIAQDVRVSLITN